MERANEFLACQEGDAVNRADDQTMPLGNPEAPPRASGVAKRIGFVGLGLFALLGLTSGLSGVLVFAGLYVMVTGLWAIVRRRSWLGPMRRRLGAGVLAGGLVLTIVGGAAAGPADGPRPTAASPTASTSASASSTSPSTPEPKAVSVIDVTGANKDSAKSMLGNLQFDVAFVGEGSTVDSQDPAPGATVDPGSTVTLKMRLSDQEVAEAAAAQAAATEAAKAAEAAATEAAKAAEAAAAAKAAAAAEAAAAAAAAEEAARGTVSQQNALRSAAGYLDYTAFSRSGLIKQLEYEGFSTEDATWGVDRVSVDWNEQAAKSAKSYLEYTAFSRSGLVKQLLYEGFTPEQAEYGVSQTGL
jgi:Xaa-Pro aminopeptidase